MRKPRPDAPLLALGRRIAALKSDRERRDLLILYAEISKAWRRMEASARGEPSDKIVLRGRVRLIKRASKKRILAHSVAQQVKLARSRKGWRQEDLARRTGIARPNIARLEAGRYLPKLATLSIVADALAIDLKSLVSMPKPLYGGPDARLAEQGLADWDRELKRIDRL